MNYDEQTFLARFRDEARLAIDNGGEALTEMLDPATLMAQPAEDGQIVLTSDGRRVGAIPTYRLAPLDPNATIEKLLSGDLPAEMSAAIRAGRFEVLDPGWSDLVYAVVWPVEGQPPRLVTLLRSALVPSWPDDVPERAVTLEELAHRGGGQGGDAN